MKNLTDIKKVYEMHLKLERMQKSLNELDTFIKGVLKSEHPISIRIDVDTPKEEKCEDSAEKLERFLRNQSPNPIFFSRNNTVPDRRESSDNERTEPLDVTETVVLLTTLLNMRRAKMEKLRQDLEKLSI